MVWNNKLIIDNSICDLIEDTWIGIGLITNVTTETSHTEQINDLRLIENEIRSKFISTDITKHPIIRAYRDFYWRIGIDPTKQRPSSEALLRRILQNKNIPSINNVVDAGNMASLITLISIGLYDSESIEGDITFRLSKKNEHFTPIGGQKTLINEGQPVLADNKRIIHLYPHRDSSETMITQKTKNVIVLSLGVPNINKNSVNDALETTLKLISKYAKGIVSQKQIIRIC